ncbi:LCP family protein [Modestobacter sp. NPDC049651]|uniref:LCP family protein n=1 Tax=unclassified Modestobacter TaxID=2643866 RepID=UPI0033D07776
MTDPRDRPPLPGRLDPRVGRGSPRSAGAPRDGGERRTTRHRRSPAVIARLVGGLLSVLLLAGSGWGWYLARVAQASVSRTDAIPADGNTDVNGKDHAGQEMNLLLVGMDSRKGLTAEQQAEFSTGDPDGVLNTDTMILVHIPADGSAASFVSFPRDTYVAIPGHGKGRINSAYAIGYNGTDGSDAQRDAAGAQLLIRTVSQLSGLQIDHFAEVNLLGFINLSQIVGGVQVNLCQATKDPLSGADFPAGVQTITGKDALAFVRQRHELKNGDLDRVVRQQVYIAGMLRNVLSSHVLLNLSKQKQIVEQVGSSVTFDRDLDVFDLAAQMQNVQPGDITFQTIPGLTPQRVDGAEILQPPSKSVLTSFFAGLTADEKPEQQPAAPSSQAAPKTADPADVSVQVANGSSIAGAAKSAASALAGAGFEAASGGNADRTATTTVRYHSGDEAAANAVAGQVPGAALAVDDSVAAGTVQLVIGADYNGIGKAVTPQAPVPDAGGGDQATPRTAQDTSCIN